MATYKLTNAAFFSLRKLIISISAQGQSLSNNPHPAKSQLTSMLGKVFSELGLVEHVKVGHRTNVHVSAGTALDSLEQGWRERTRVFAPTDFESTRVYRQAIDVCVLVELHGGSAIDECDKLSRVNTYHNNE